MVYITKTKSPIGVIWLAKTSKGLCKLTYPDKNGKQHMSWLKKVFGRDVQLIEDAGEFHRELKELKEYFQDQRKTFQLPFDLITTEFEKKALGVVAQIPFGTTLTYKQVAEKIMRPRSYRAVGNALAKNPLGIVIPCHRVLRSDNLLGGYSGGLKNKSYLLSLEGFLPTKHI